MAQVREAFCNVTFAYAASPPGRLAAAQRLARYLKVPRNALKIRLRELNIYLPPLHAVLRNDMSTFDFSVQRNNHPTREAIYGNLPALVAEMFPPVRVYLARLQAKGTGPPPGECPFVCTPLCAAHRSLSARRS